jgi:type I site-specific restriction endonuclease
VNGAGHNILILPARTRQAPESHTHVLAADLDPNAQSIDLTGAAWLKHPDKDSRSAFPRNRVIEETLDSWKNSFSYIEEDVAQHVVGLRKPQVGALHAIHAHWTVSRRTATIVMPTGTGKTDTMLSV